MNELKVGQRIDVYNAVDNEWELPYKVGNTYVGRHTPETEDRAEHIKLFDGQDTWSAFTHEVKKIGVFIVREVKTNTDPCTII